MQAVINNFLFYSGDIDGLNILWNGYYFDGETGNYYLKNRYYSPIERRFLTEDPHGIIPDENWNNPFGILNQYTDGVGLTVYAGFNPITGRDDWGLKSVCKIKEHKMWDVDFSKEFPYIKIKKVLYKLTSAEMHNPCECGSCCDEMYEIWKKNVSPEKNVIAGRKTREYCNTSCLYNNIAEMML